MPEVRVNGIRLYYEEHGEGQPILCIHGSGSSALLWASAVDPLSRLGRVILYDRRGCGRSERPTPFDAMTVEEEAEDAAALLDELGAVPAVVIGRSHGGSIGLTLARRRPDYVRALALLEGAPLALDATAMRWEDELNSRILAAADREPETVGETLIRGVLGEDSWETFPAALRELFTANGPAIAAEIRGGSHLEEAELRGIKHPALVVIAADSGEPLRLANERLAEILPGAELSRVEGGHVIDPAGPEVLRFVERFAA